MEPIPLSAATGPSWPLVALDQEAALRRSVFADGRPAADEMLQVISNAMELCFFGGVLCEIVAEFGLVTWGEIQRSMPQIDSAARLRLHFDPEDLVRRNAQLAEPWGSVPFAPGAPHVLRMSDALRGARGMLAVVEIDGLMAAVQSRPELAPLAHRCRRAFDALAGFVARHSRPDLARVRAVGVAYAEGRLSVDEVAGALGVSPSDAVTLLEEGGHARGSAHAGLEPAAEAQKLARIRAERLSRGGEPQRDPDLIRRDVVASQRIEDIDARAWVKPA